MAARTIERSNDTVGRSGRKGGAEAAINPVTKLAILFFLAVFVLFIDSALIMIAFFVTVLVAKFVWRARALLTRGVIGFGVVIFFAQVLFVHDGTVFFHYGWLMVTEGGIKHGILIAGRFLSIIMMSWVFVATTTPAALSAGLIQIGVPYRYAFLLVLAMRFVPIFSYELATVREAQAMRGLRVGRSFRGLIRSVRYTTLPLLMSALARVNTLAASMEGRGFGMYPKKTVLYPVPMRRADIATLVLAVVVALEVLFLDAMVVLW